MKTFNPGPNPQLSHEYVNYRSLHIWNALPAAFFGFALFCLSYTTSFLPSYPWLPRAFRDRLTTNHVLLQSSCSSGWDQEPDSSLCSWPKGDENSNGHLKQHCRDLWETSFNTGSNRISVTHSSPEWEQSHRLQKAISFLWFSTDGWPPIRLFPHGQQSLWGLLIHSPRSRAFHTGQVLSRFKWFKCFPSPSVLFKGHLDSRGHC